MKRLFYVVLLVSCGFFISAHTYNDHEKNTRKLNEAEKAGSSAVLLNNQAGLIPLKELQYKKIASLSLGVMHAAVFDSIAEKYEAIACFSDKDSVFSKSDPYQMRESLKLYNTLLIQLSEDALKERDILPFILQIQKEKSVALVFYGDQQGLALLDSVDVPIITMPQETPESASIAAQIIFGGAAAKGKLEKTVSLKYREGDGFLTQADRLGYTFPEAVGINTNDLEKPIDEIVEEAIARKATPGAVVLVAKDGKVIFNKAYGYHTYENIAPTRVSDIFDLASVTKISATTIAAMQLYEQQKLKLDAGIGTYIPEVRNTNKSNISIRELMLHQAGLVPYIPFYQRLKPGDYSRDSSDVYSVKVADHYYLRKNYYQDVMWPAMVRSHLQSQGKYVYSDLSMYFLKEILERQTSESLSAYMQEKFYGPLGMYTAGFNPRSRFQKTAIVPTENDTYFRMTLLDGFVHDQGAAMSGGVSGHAGLFSSANDMAILFQLLLNRGTYGGVQYFKPETIDLFTERQSAVSRRGLGFDRWDPESNTGYPSELASPQTYGHTGFTGTCVWVDPKYNLIYIFLSNRVQSAGGNKLQSMKIRPRIQDAIYRAILKSDMALSYGK